MHENHIGLFILQGLLQFQQHVTRHVKERLPRLHDSQIVVGLDVEYAQHLIEHLAMLSRDGHNSLKLVRTALQLVHERTHLDCLRTSAEDEHYLLHRDKPPKLAKPRFCLGKPSA